MEETELEGKTALVTETATGIGRACALALASAGADVALSYHKAKGAALDVGRQIREIGRRALAIQADVSNSAEVSNLFLMAEEQLGGVDILVNNAGPFARRCLADLSDAEWEDIIEPNLYGAFYCCREALPHMREEEWGRIINITFEAPESPETLPDIGPYAIARVAMVALTKTLALEEAANGITVNALGPVLAEANHTAEEPNPTNCLEPTLQVAGPDELARAVLFLASPRSPSVNGAHLTIQGGWQP